jgi:transmembrane sensor
MNEKLAILRRYFNNKYSLNDYKELKRLLLSEDSGIESLMQAHWNEFMPEEFSGRKDLSEVLRYINRKADKDLKVPVLKKLFFVYSRLAAILIIPLLLASGFLCLYLSQYLHNENVFVEVQSPAGARTSLNLPDGTLVWLNGDSHIRYPVSFGRNREVRIDGEAFFRVKSDKKHPFLVDAKNVVVKATGTEFNIKAYNDDPEVRVILKEGKVTVSDDKQSVLKEMGKGHQLSYFEKSYSAKYSEINAENYASWIDGRLIFNHASLAEVVERMERWYGVDIEVTDKELLQLHFKATFVDESIEESLKLLQATATFNFKFVQRSIQQNGLFEKSKILITKK